MNIIKKNKKKFFCAIISISISIVLILILFFVDNNKIKIVEYDKTIPLKILIADSNKTKANVNLDDMNNGKISSILSFTYTDLLLKKQGDFYVGNLKNINSNILSNVTDYEFALNNHDGIVLKDCTFDKKSNKIKIPINYFKQKSKSSPVQFEILSRMKKNDFQNLKIKVSTKRFITKNKEIVTSGSDVTTTFSISKYKRWKGVSKSDINIYLNDYSTKLSSDDFVWNSSAGTIELSISPLTIRTINIVITKKTFFSNLLGISNANAVKYSNMRVYKTLPSEPFIKEGLTFNKNLTVRYGDFQTDNGAICNTFITENKGKDWSKYDACVRGWKKMYGYGGSYAKSYAASGTNTNSVNYVAENTTNVYLDFLVDLSGETISKTVGTGDDAVTYSLTFPPLTWISLMCYHVGSGYDAGWPSSGVDIEVIKSTSSYVVLGFKTARANSQNGFGIYKFSLDDSKKGAVKVTKTLTNDGVEDTTTAKSNIKFSLYDESGCSDDDKIDTVVTGSDGIATFDDLEIGEEYWVKERSGLNSTYWADVTGCKSVGKITTNNTILNGYYTVSTTIIDPKQKYCLKVKKIDADTSCPINGITFGIYNSSNTLISSGNTSGAGEYEVDGIDYGAYTFKETSANGTLATQACSNGSSNFAYWNDSSTGQTVSGLTAMGGYNSTTGKWTTCGATSASNARSDRKYYYCLKVKKTDKATGEGLKGATIHIDGFTDQVTDDNGVATFMLGTNGTVKSVKETKAPVGYALTSGTGKNPLSVTPTLMPQGTTLTQSSNSAYCNANADSYIFENPVYFINWYKTSEDKKIKEPNAKFTVSSGSNLIHHSASKVVAADDSNPAITKSCYVYSSNASDSTEFVSDANGEVCVRGMPQGDYKVTETLPSQYHTFGKEIEKTVSAQTTFASMVDTNHFINEPTQFEFSKSVLTTKSGLNVDDDTTIVVNGVQKKFSELTTEELSNIDFEIYETDSNGNKTGSPLSFVYKDLSNNVVADPSSTNILKTSGIYNFAGNTIDGPGTTGVTTILHLGSNRKIRVDHLAWGKTYTIREVNSKSCGGNDGDCIGYYYPNYTETGAQASNFTITTCSNPLANSTSCPNGINKMATQSLNNTPTEITFTKKDFYNSSSNNDQSDVSDIERESSKEDSSVEFVNDKERSDFDRIEFKIKDSSGNYLTLKHIGNSTTTSCKADSDFSEYRYVSTDSSDGTSGTIMHTCGGHIRITNLCRGMTYTIEEISVPDDSVYVKENTSSTPTSVKYNIPCAENASNMAESTTSIIYDKPTETRFEKRDSKYNYLIPDETTTFELYRCKSGDTDCHPSDYSTDEEREAAGMELVKFYPRSIITGDEEDTLAQAEENGNIAVEVYRRMSDTDVNDKNNYVTKVHPDHGILIFRYLQANYSYVLLETVAPKNYQMPIGRNAETLLKTVSNETVDIKPVDVPNKPTSLLIKKYDSKGNLLSGAEFKVYEGTTCDANLSAMNQPKTELKLKTIRDGIYEARENTDTSIVQTCKDNDDEKCSDIKANGTVTQMTYETNLGNWTNFADSSTSTKDATQIEIQEGTALIQYLEYGHCYILEEVKAPTGHSLPEKAEDRFTMVTIDENDEYAHSTEYKFVNIPTPFQFYKYDEFNQLLDGAEFKLQKLDDNKKYHDVVVSLDESLSDLDTTSLESLSASSETERLIKQMQNLKTQAANGVPFYKASFDSNVKADETNTKILTANGTAVVYYLQPGQYRVVETKAAEGYELPKNGNIATFFVDDSGAVYGNKIIANKKPIEEVEYKPASAELIVNIQTGQVVIKYGLIIALIVALISGLMILKRKTK